MELKSGMCRFIHKSKEVYLSRHNFCKLKYFLEGLSSCFDLYGANSIKRTYKSDYEAIESDWKKIGQDMYTATHIFKNESFRKKY